MSVTTQATDICYHTKETLVSQHKLQRKHTDRYRHSSIEADWHLCFYYGSKNEEYHCFWVFCKNCNINDFVRGHPVSVTVFLSILFTSMIHICLASMCFRVSSCVFLVLCYLFIWSCPARRGLCRSVSVLCFLFYFSSALLCFPFLLMCWFVPPVFSPAALVQVLTLLVVVSSLFASMFPW